MRGVGRGTRRRQEGSVHEIMDRSYAEKVKVSVPAHMCHARHTHPLHLRLGSFQDLLTDDLRGHGGCEI